MAFRLSAKTIAEASSRIFGNVIPDGKRSGRKLLMKALKGAHVASWYPDPVQIHDPGFQDPDEETRLAKVRVLKQRGKGAPKKGEGKRSKKAAGKK